MSLYEQLKAEKEARHLRYYKRVAAIEEGLIKPNPALRECSHLNIRTSKRELVRPRFKSAL